MEVAVGRHAGQSQVGWSHVGRCWSVSRALGDDSRSLRRPDALPCVGLSWNWSVFLGRPYHGTPLEGPDIVFVFGQMCPWCSRDTSVDVAA